jgi:hypothetical protein
MLGYLHVPFAPAQGKHSLMTRKRRKRKRKPKQDSELMKQVIIPRESEQPASPVEIELEVEIEESVGPVEIHHAETRNLASSVAVPAHAEKPTPASVGTTGADRRAHPR